MTQKDMERVTVQFSCDGPIGGIVALADAYGNVRGYVTNPAAEAPERNGKLNVAGIVGSGTMHVRREAGFEIGLMKEPYHGIVEIVSGEIAADFAYYLTTSEQIPSATSLGVFVSLATGQVVAAGGYMVQMMSGSDRALADELSARIAAAPSVTDMILAGATPLSMLETALVDLPIEVLETREVQFTCTCSRDRVLAMLASLERDEVRTMLDDGTGETVICHVCNESYAISVEDLRAILATN